VSTLHLLGCCDLTDATALALVSWHGPVFP